MPALNFEKRFAEMVRSGEKLQTIRAQRKRPICEGDTLYLKNGMRTKACEALGTGTCTRIRWIVIHRDLFGMAGDLRGMFGVNHQSMPNQLLRFARADGFAGWADLTEWFDRKHGLPFSGTLIEWELQ